MLAQVLLQARAPWQDGQCGEKPCQELRGGTAGLEIVKSGGHAMAAEIKRKRGPTGSLQLARSPAHTQGTSLDLTPSLCTTEVCSLMPSAKMC